MTKIAHIINTITKDENPELYVIQDITLKSILKAKSATRYKDEVLLFSVSFSETDAGIPADFKQLPALTKHTALLIKDQKRKLPFIKDILGSVIHNTEAEYIVYSNLDIGLMPYFYDSVLHYIKEGHDALVINRRRIKDRFSIEKDLEVMYAEVGEKHPGYDCFVVKREVLMKFNLKNISIGVPPFGNDLFHNIFTFAQNPVLLSEKHLTFHIGMTIIKEWGEPLIEKHNYKEYKTLIKELEPFMDANKFPGADLGFLNRHFKWLMNFTFSYPLMFRLDSKRGFKRKKIIDKFPVKKQRYIEWLIRKVGFKDN